MNDTDHNVCFAPSKKAKRILQIIGVLLTLFGLFAFTFFQLVLVEPVEPFFKIFVLVVSSFYIAAGIGAFTQAKFSFYLLWFITVLLFFMFPIGTILSFLLYRFLKQPDVKFLFFNNAT